MLVARYPTKKALKSSVGQPLKYKETSMFGPQYCDTGRLDVVGPTEYNRKWYANVWMENGIIKKVK